MTRASVSPPPATSQTAGVNAAQRATASAAAAAPSCRYTTSEDTSSRSGSKPQSPSGSSRHLRALSTLRVPTAQSKGLAALQKYVHVKEAVNGQQVVDAFALLDGTSLINVAEKNLQHMEEYLGRVNKLQPPKARADFGVRSRGSVKSDARHVVPWQAASVQCGPSWQASA
jgi:hypothetical protein